MKQKKTACNKYSSLFKCNALLWLKKGCFPKNVFYKKTNGADVGILENLEGVNETLLADSMCIRFSSWSYDCSNNRGKGSYANYAPQSM